MYVKTLLPIIIVAVLGTVFVNIGLPWFNALTKPSQWIPNFVIPIVWTIIYVTFAVILILIQNKTKLRKTTTVLLYLNGVLNILWCLVFFTLKQMFIGDIIIILNLIAAFMVVINIKRYKRLYYYILLIYPAWVSIATTLNLAIWILN